MKSNMPTALMVAWFCLGSMYFFKGNGIEMLLCFVLSSVWYGIYEQTKNKEES